MKVMNDSGDLHIRDPVIQVSLFSWKQQFKNIFLLQTEKYEFVFRALTRGEYKTLLEMQTFFGLDTSEDEVLKWGLLYPTLSELDQYLAGDIQNLLKNILDISGFSDPTNVIEGIDYFRSVANTLDEQITCYICKAFPKITPSDVDKFDFPTLMRHLVLAEKILDVPLNFQELKIQMAKARRQEEQGTAQTPILAEQPFSWKDDLKETSTKEFSNAPPPGDWDIRNRK